MKQIEAISRALMLNTHVKSFVLQDNWLTPESAFLIGEMLTENNTITYLNLKECRIGPEGTYRYKTRSHHQSITKYV